MKIKINDLEFSYGSRKILQGITMELVQHEVLAIVGPNGTGKSTLIKCIGKLLNPQKGNIFLAGKNLEKMNRAEIARFLGYIPQSSSSLFQITVMDMVLLGRRPHLTWHSSKKDQMKALKALQLLGVENLAMRNFNELSGGQQQKVTIAAGDPVSVLTSENIAFVFGVEVVVKNENGRPYIVPIRPLEVAGFSFGTERQKEYVLV